jgi:HlyD family secretion protein
MARIGVPVAAVLLVSAALIAGVFHLTRSTSTQPEFRTAAVVRGSVQSLITATGTVRPVVTTDVSTQVSGQIAEVLVDFNDRAEKDQILARLDPQTYIARVRESEAELEVARAEALSRDAALARANAMKEQKTARRRVQESKLESARAVADDAQRALERQRALVGRGGISDSDLQEAETKFASSRALLLAEEGQLLVLDAEIAAAEAEVSMARALLANAWATIRQREAALEEARVNLGRTDIRAPLDAVIIRRDVEAGQTVAASLQAPTLFTLAEDLSRMRIDTHVDEADIGRLQAGQEAFFTVEAYPGRRFRGKVSAIHKAPNLLHNVVTYRVLVEAENPDLALFPGMTAVVRIVVAEATDALKIPNAALRFVPRGADRKAPAAADEIGEETVKVWRPDATGKPEPLRILTGPSDQRHTVLLEGPLEEGDFLIVGYEEP